MEYNSSELLCGIDGGGTTTKVVVSNLKGNVVCSFLSDTINHYGAGSAKVAKTFKGIASKLNKKLECLPSIIFVGNSALEGLANDALVLELTQGAFTPSKVVFHSDVYIALLGFTLGNAGAVLISGTGSMACGIDDAGKYYTVGGWGQTLGDEGSGYHMAINGIKAALRAHDGLQEPTILSQKLKSFFGLNHLHDIIDKVYNPPAEKSFIAAFSIEVANAAEEGDLCAIKIHAEEARWLYKLALSVTNKCKTTNLGYYGSVLTRNSMIRNQLQEKLAVHSIHIQEPLFKPEIGALIGAFEESGNRINDDIFKNLAKYK